MLILGLGLSLLALAFLALTPALLTSLINLNNSTWWRDRNVLRLSWAKHYSTVAVTSFRAFSF